MITSWIWAFAVETWNMLAEMAPYLLFGFAVAGALSVLITPEWVERHLKRGSWGPVLKASLFGVPLPLCSCGVLPVAASLRKHGASRGAATAFLISTPQTGVDSILVTYSLLGPVFAILRPAVAFLSGILGGWAVNAFESREEKDSDAKQSCTDSCCSPSEKKRSRISQALHHGFVALPRDLARSLTVGILLAGLISMLTPKDFFSAALGAGFGAMIVMMLAGIPLYVCATASVPIAAALLAKGLSPGAALVFLTTGPATNAAAILTLWAIMGRRTTLIYLATLAVSSLAAGWLLDHLWMQNREWFAAAACHESMSVWRHAAAIALLGVIGFALAPARKAPKMKSTNPDEKSRSPGRGETIQLRIQGMTCQHCAQSVERVLGTCEGVRTVQVILKDGLAIVTGGPLDYSRLCRTVETLGYSIAGEHKIPDSGKGESKTC